MAVVVIAPDSFKGTIGSIAAAEAIASGWRRARPDDRLILVPLADGGEGTLDVLATRDPSARRHAVSVSAPVPGDPAVEGTWLELARPGGSRIGVVELAAVAGLPLYSRPAPLTAHTRGVGETIGAALDAGVDEVWVALGGSGSTDGGSGALAALGARLGEGDGREMTPGGAVLADLEQVDVSGLRPPPAGGVLVLTDVTAPLLGPTGAAVVFGPQKGAGVDDVRRLDAALGQWARVLGGDPSEPGAGAAGGTAFGLRAWGARIVPGAPTIARALGLGEAVAEADVVVTGEGRFDAQSFVGKAPGHVLDLARDAGAQPIVIAGVVADAPAGLAARAALSLTALSLAALAGSPEAARRDARRWLEVAGERAARGFPG